MTGQDNSRPVRLLIAAMGGEGGGVLAGWLTEAALDAGLWVQRTSVPGVAQRTGATTYYLEFLPRTGPDRPIMSLHPVPGQVDVLVATELLEAMRMIQAGFVTPSRTTLIASTHRTYTVDEKSAMGDGRRDPEPIIAACRKFAKRSIIRDLARVSAQENCHLNSVVMGLLAGADVLPLPEASCRKAIEAGKRASTANMRGFEAGLSLARDLAEVPDLRGSAGSTTVTQPDPSPRPTLPASADTSFLPPEAAGLAAEGMRRLAEYQDQAYADRYLAHLRRVAQHPNASPSLLATLARHMAVRMSYEDIHRVAELKLKPSRLENVRNEARATHSDIVDVSEYMKPGPEELFGMLPERLGAWLTRISERRGWTYSFPMKVRTTRFFGFIRLKLLAKAKRWRPRSLRHAQEMRWLETWLSHVESALDKAPRAAIEIVETASLVRGYGSTFKRGKRNWQLIESEIIAPGLEGRFDPELLADATLQGRLSALKDPEGQALDNMVAAFRSTTSPGQA